MNKKKDVCQKKEPKKDGNSDNESRNCYTLKKHPSATNVEYQPRQCPDPDKYKKKCPPSLDVCEDPNVEDVCKKKKKRGQALFIEDDIVVQERAKPPRCPQEEDPCANDNKAICKKISEKVFPNCGKRDDDDDCQT